MRSSWCASTRSTGLIFGSGGELLATPDVERMERAIAALSPADAASSGLSWPTTA